MTGDVEVGDEVVLNTTAMELGLGTGGYHFVIYNVKNPQKDIEKKSGHIMKLRYTPMQCKFLSIEEQHSVYNDAFNSFKKLNKSIYVVGALHSMLPPVAATLKWLRPQLNITYIMTDAGSLPIHFSKNVKKLKEKKIISNTITVGHAFGGDIECVNIYTGIIASEIVAKSDITIITMGPGIVGTGTKYGFSGIEQGYIIDAVNNLGGVSFAIPRISFADKRKRHNGISHHTITVLSEITNTRTNLPLPILSNNFSKIIDMQLRDSNIINKHNIIYNRGEDVIKALKYYDLNIKTMGRSYNDDEAFFLTLGAVAKACINHLDNR